MNWNEILNIVLAVLGVVFALLGYYCDIKAKITKAANEKIDEAEEEGVNGENKMAYVVDELYKIVPTILRPVFTKAVLKKLVQALFDNIENYAKKQINKK